MFFVQLRRVGDDVERDFGALGYVEQRMYPVGEIEDPEKGHISRKSLLVASNGRTEAPVRPNCSSLLGVGQ
jgi:hypothetical protein